MKILLVESNQRFGDQLSRKLLRSGHAIDHFVSLADGVHAAKTATYEFIIVAQDLCDGSGLTLLRAVRSDTEASPVLVIAHEDNVEDRLTAFDEGADDYLVAPFDLRELTARITSIARRSRSDSRQVCVIGPVRIDLPMRTVWYQDRLKSLTAREWIVLEVLMNRQEAVIPKAEFEARLQDYGAQVDSNTVEVFVSRIRKKLGRELIHTERGLGYRLGYRSGKL